MLTDSWYDPARITIVAPSGATWMACANVRKGATRVPDEESLPFVATMKAPADTGYCVEPTGFAPAPCCCSGPGSCGGALVVVLGGALVVLGGALVVVLGGALVAVLGGFDEAVLDELVDPGTGLCDAEGLAEGVAGGVLADEPLG
jgi:hypothetical protein